MTQRAETLKAAGRIHDALSVFAEAARLHPASAVAEHNLAATLGDLARHAEAERHCRTAMAKGLDAPETWLILARALQGQRRLDEAEAAYREALRRRAMPDAHRDFAQLIWMRTGDLAAATALLDQAIAKEPRNPTLRLVRAKAQEYAGDDTGAYDTLRDVLASQEDFVLQAMAADAAVRLGEARAAMTHAERAVALGPGEALAETSFVQTCLAAGAPDRALPVLAALRQRSPQDQHLIALLATAWRLLGDSRYAELYNYGAFVGVGRLRTPPGWPDLGAYLVDLAEALTDTHAYSTHPYGQSLRQGSQTPDVLQQDHPAIRAFPSAVEPAIAEHLRRLGRGTDPLRSRNTGHWVFKGAWSVRLRPHGFHVDHVHPQGWLSSACYIALPDAVDGPGREGWLKFGEPGIATAPSLGPEHFVKPEPGLLALFPSYMWHGTVPFGGDQTRLTIAFDIVPA